YAGAVGTRIPVERNLGLRRLVVAMERTRIQRESRILIAVQRTWLEQIRQRGGSEDAVQLGVVVCGLDVMRVDIEVPAQAIVHGQGRRDLPGVLCPDAGGESNLIQIEAGVAEVVLGRVVATHSIDAGDAAGKC